MVKREESNSDQVYKLIDISTTEKLNEDELIQIIKKDSSVCEERYPVESISLERIYPLHAICVLGGSLNLIKKVYKAYPSAIEDNSTSVGNVLHYCCMFNEHITVETMHFLASKRKELLSELNLGDERTPLHVACSYDAKHDIVAYLTEKYPEACTQIDQDGFTPLVRCF
jgi:Ankyrin repeats (3 copies)